MDFSCQYSEPSAVVKSLSQYDNTRQQICYCCQNDPMKGDILHRKRSFRRVGPDLETKQKDSDPENELSPIQYSEWVNLPYVALVEIYKCLSNQDRFSLSLTCKAWSQPFSQPDIWRHVKFRFDGIEDWRASLFVGPLAMGVRHLEIKCTNASGKIGRSKIGSLNCLYDFLDGLIKCGNCNLVTLKIVNMVYLYHLFGMNDDRDILEVLGDLLSIQTNLKILDLSGAGFKENEGIYLLSRIAPSAKLSSLSINNLFDYIENVPEITTCLEIFINLKELTISYENLSDDLLDALAASGSLKCINVFALQEFVLEEFDFSPPFRESWKELKKSCPSLEAHYHFHRDLMSLETLMNILTPEIPLVSLEFWLVAPHSDWPDVCAYIIDNFKNRLRSLTTYICEYTVSKDPILNAINAFIESCQCLEELTVTDTVNLLPDQHFIMRSIKKAIKRQPASKVRKFGFSALQPADPCVWKYGNGHATPVEYIRRSYHYRSSSR